MANLAFVAREEFDRIRSLPCEPARQVRLFAEACRINTLYMIARAGSGHLGTSFSSLDIMACLHLQVMHGAAASLEQTCDVFFSSKGHDVPARYAVLLAMGLLDFSLLHRLRRLGGLPGHPDLATPFMYTNTGSLGMGISKARGMALARRQLGPDGHFFVMTGDGELQEGQFWESLQPTANQAVGEITVIVDHNKLQSDTFVSNVSDLGDLERKIAAFGWDVVRCDGHDIDQLLTILPPDPDAFRPRCIIADTVKGKGVSFMEHTAMRPEDRLYLYHSGAPSVDDYEQALAELHQRVNDLLRDEKAEPLRLTTVPREEPAYPRLAPPPLQRLVSAYGEAMVSEGERCPELVVLDADLAKDTGLLGFEKRFPERFFECGIAEQDMVSQAGGMALAGLLPVVHSFACFLSDRPNEQIYNNATEKTRIIYAGSLAGLLPGMPGHSHQCVRDIAALSGVPGLALLEPCCEEETRQAVAFAVNDATESVYLRLVSVPCAIPFELPAEYCLVPGQGTILRDGDDAVVIGYGPVLLAEAWKAAVMLEQVGIGVRLVNLPWLNRVDRDWLYDCVKNHWLLVTLDNHYVAGGQGQYLLAELAQTAGLNGQQRVCLGVREIPLCGTNAEVLAAHGLDAASLARELLTQVRGEPARAKAA